MYQHTIEDYSDVLKEVLINVLTDVKIFAHQPDVVFRYGAVGAEGFYNSDKLALSFEIPPYGMPINFFKINVLNAINKEIDKLTNK